MKYLSSWKHFFPGRDPSLKGTVTDWWLKINLRFFVEHHEAKQVSEVWRPEGFPLDHYFIAHGSDLGKLQHMVFTWEKTLVNEKQ